MRLATVTVGLHRRESYQTDRAQCASDGGLVRPLREDSIGGKQAVFADTRCRIEQGCWLRAALHQNSVSVLRGRSSRIANAGKCAA